MQKLCPTLILLTHRKTFGWEKWLQAEIAVKLTLITIYAFVRRCVWTHLGDPQRRLRAVRITLDQRQNNGSRITTLGRKMFKSAALIIFWTLSNTQSCVFWNIAAISHIDFTLFITFIRLLNSAVGNEEMKKRKKIAFDT